MKRSLDTTLSCRDTLWYIADMTPKSQLRRLVDQFQEVILLEVIDQRGANSALVIVDAFNDVWPKPDHGKQSIQGGDR